MKIISPISFYENPIVFCGVKEIWLPISKLVHPNICSYYYVSNFGRVYSAYSKKILTNILDSDGYENLCLHLTKPNPGCLRNQISKRVNRIVMLTFYPILNYEYYLVNHIDGNKSNNKLWNLEWVTPKENVDHAFLYGLRQYQNITGELNPCAKLTESQVRLIYSMIKSGKYKTYVEIANIIGISDSAVAAIAQGKSWTHLKLNDSMIMNL